MFFGGDPFEHFGGHQHGGRSGGGGRARRPAANVDNKLYETLGVSLRTLQDLFAVRFVQGPMLTFPVFF
jgi:hypothetical protein